MALFVQAPYSMSKIKVQHYQCPIGDTCKTGEAPSHQALDALLELGISWGEAALLLAPDAPELPGPWGAAARHLAQAPSTEGRASVRKDQKRLTAIWFDHATVKVAAPPWLHIKIQPRPWKLEH